MRRGLFLLLALTVLLLGGWARIHHLDAQSLWNDEGNSLRLAQRAPGDLIEAAGRDIHPPGYYLGLKLWIGLAGDSELSLRVLSALAGLLTVAAVIALGRALFGRSAALFAGVITALHPFAVYYSQEARMYAALGLFSVLSTWVFVRWVKTEEKFFTAENAKNTEKNRGTQPHSAGRCHRLKSVAIKGKSPLKGLLAAPSASSTHFFNSPRYPALALALLTAAGLYTQYSYPFTMIAQGLFFLLWIASRRRVDQTARRALRDYSLINGLALLIFLPWLPTAWDQVTNWPRTGVNLPLAERLHTVFTWILAGNTAGDISGWWFIVPGLLLIAALLLRDDRRSYSWRVGLPFAWGEIVIGALIVSGAYREANLKFLLPAQAAAALLIGRGLSALWTNRRVKLAGPLAAIIGLIAVLGVQINALDALYTDPAYARDDYRAMVARITANHLRPDDAIILDAPNQAEVFTYYYHGSAPIYELPRGLGGDDDSTRAAVQDVINQHHRIFVLFWGETERDPQHVVETTLDAEAFPVAEQWYGDVRLAQYAVLGEPSAEPQMPTNAHFGDQITLLGYTLSDDSPQPGDALGLTLYWTTAAPLDIRYKVTVQLLAPDGRLIVQHDAEPGGDRALTTTWTPQQTILDTHGLIIPPDLPPGIYTIMVALYNIDQPASRLLVAGADHFTLSPLEFR